MKRFLFLLVVLSLSYIAARAEHIPGNPVLTISTVTIDPEAATVEVPVTVSDFSGIGIISLELIYPHAEISSPTVVYLNPALDDWDTFEANMAVTDTIIISAMDPDLEPPYSGLTLSDGDTLFIISFTVGTISDFADVYFYDNVEGISCEITGPAPDYPEFIDTPAGDYYINGGVELLDLAPGEIGTAQFICEDSDAAAFTSIADAVGEGIISYIWQYSITNGEENFFDIEGEDGATYNPGNLTQDTWYRRIATAFLNDVSWDEPSNVILVTVINFEPGSISSGQTICEGGIPATFSDEAASGDGSITYQWQLSTTGPSSGFSNIPDATGHDYSSGSLDADTWFRREATASLGGTSCVEYSNAIEIKVINFDAGSIAGSDTLCEGEDPLEFTSVAGYSGDGEKTYQWQVSTTGESTGFSDIDGATTAVYDTTAVAADVWFRRATTSAVNDYTCTEYSNVVSLRVNYLDAGEIGSDQYIAEGGDPSELTSESDATGRGDISYQWEISVTGPSGEYTQIENATSSAYDPGVLIADAWYRRVATSTFSTSQCSAISNVVAVIVINLDPGSVSGNQTSCQDEDFNTFSSITGATGDGDITYQWQSCTTGAEGPFADITDSTGVEFDPGVVGVDTWYRRQAIASIDGHQVAEYSNVLSITAINITPGSIDNAQTLCYGEDAAALTNVEDGTGDGIVGYQWQSSTTSATEGFSDIPDATGSTYDPGVLPVTTWFRRVASVTVSEVTCEEYSGAVKITINQKRTISGQFYYHNAAGNILMTGQNITVSLYKTSDITHEVLIGSVVTDEDGYYEFTDLCPECEYDIVATSDAPCSNAINTTDAAMANYWGAHSCTIEKVKFYAGDVGTVGECQDLTINSTDAGRIQRNFVYGTSFDRKWTFWKAGSTICQNPALKSYPSVYLTTESNLSQNMYALVTGDFNRSYNPATMFKSAGSNLLLVNDGNRVIDGTQEFSLPVRMVNGGSVTAVSLVLNIPAELAEVRDVVMTGESAMLDWAVNGNELRIGWFSQNPVYLSANEELFSLQLKTAAGFSGSTPLTITLANDPMNEIANEKYDAFSDAILAIESVNASSLGTGDPMAFENGLTLANRPNPFDNATRFTYTLPVNGMVTLEIHTLMGGLITAVINEFQSAGAHEAILNMPDLPAGIYIAALKLNAGGSSTVKTLKIIKR